MTDPQQPLRAALLAPVVILALCIAGCIQQVDVPKPDDKPVPVTSLTAMATKAEQVERVEVAAMFDELSIKAKSAKSAKEVIDAWGAAVHETRRAVWGPVEKSVDAAWLTDGRYDPKKGSKAMADLASGVRKAGK